MTCPSSHKGDPGFESRLKKNVFQKIVLGCLLRDLRGKQPPPLSSPKTAVSDPDGAGGEGQEASGAESTMGGES